MNAECIWKDTSLNVGGKTWPKVHVNDQHAYFNVTRSMTFDSIEFRGENALAYVPTAADPVLPTVPLRLCTVTDADELKITGKYERI
jgi:hypothetical protein